MHIETVQGHHASDVLLLMVHPIMLLLISMVPIWAVCITCHEPYTNCGGKTVDVTPALRSFELKAAGVMMINEG